MGNDACGVDSIQVMMGCSVGKGNLLFHMRGKQAFTFFNRKNRESLRLMLKPKPEGMTREDGICSAAAPYDRTPGGHSTVWNPSLKILAIP